MNVTDVGSGEFQITSDQDDVLIANNLRCAIAMMIYDPVARVGGLLHFPLPESKPNPDWARQQPAAFADTGIPLFLQLAIESGAQKERLIVQAAGGAQMLDEPGAPQIGKKNYLAMRKVLWKTGVLMKHEEIGGTAPRAVALQLETGRMAIRDTGELTPDPLWDWEQKPIGS
ncbi:MAG: chemotaxis protein CheD [Bryobacteraceae bacterium]